ncbi:nodulation efficiency, NfeD-like protein [Halomonas cerina]|uniref:Membrane protein implicated in regulation of membrane protease activity n=1 Tax=Halomonas cerina TaxID=447424 RepID=A0A839VFP8_9GAMM|nr:nodulation efficiency, NfeD-like protein [Halomonas cerina]MBB3191454.1 membrane protein implicated in regulation of membrane protease activity [Halomonas cerina]
MDLASPALLWLLAGLGALIVELLTGSYVLLAMALAAAITAGAAWLGLGLVGQLGVLALSCGVLVPLAIRQLRRRQRSRPFGVAGTGGGLGQRFVLVQRDFDGAPCIKLDGDLFRARREGDEAAEVALRPGDEVTLLRFEGTQAIVRPTGKGA